MTRLFRIAPFACLAACGFSDSTAAKDELDAWTIEAAPSLVLSDHGSDPLYQLRSLAVSPGRIAAALGGSQSVAVFQRSGELLHTLGGQGTGPGEFEGLSDVFYLADDSVLTFDSRLRRFQVFDAAGGYVRTFGFATGGGEYRPTFPMAVLSDGVVLARQIRAGPAIPERTGVVRSTADVLRFSSDGMLLDSVAVVLGWEAFDTQVNGIYMTNVPIPFSNSTYMSGAHDRFAFASTDSNAIMVYSADGELLRTMRDVAPHGPAVEPHEIEAFKTRAIANAPPPARDGLPAVYDEMPYPATKAPFNWVVVGTDSSIWLRLPRSDAATDPWLVFDDGGSAIAELQLPNEFTPRVVSRQSVIGVWTDSLGVESVRVFDVVR